MKNLENLSLEVKRDFDALGIKYGNVVKWSVNNRAKKRWGQCKRVGINTFEIDISALVLQDDIDNQIPKNVIAHELLHTVNGCFAHRGKWKLLAEGINKKLPNYNIKTRDTFEEIIKPIIASTPKYIIHCKSCDFTATRYKRSKVIDYPYRYRCPRCRGKLYVEKNGEK